jgi:hypothetical protein
MVLEGSGGLHAHIIFIGTAEIARRLMASKNFGELLDVRRVTDANGLVRKYLAKERTPQAGYGREHVLGGRIKGSHPLEGGGDRVRLSRELERDAIDAGYVEVWRHSNARRSAERKSYRLRRLTRRAPRLAGQLPLLPEKPVSRLRDFGGGFVPPSVAREIEFRRRQRGLSQRDLGKLIGRSQGQLANALRGHDPVSAFVVNRLRDVLLGGVSGTLRHVSDDRCASIAAGQGDAFLSN